MISNTLSWKTLKLILMNNPGVVLAHYLFGAINPEKHPTVNCITQLLDLGADVNLGKSDK